MTHVEHTQVDSLTYLRDAKALPIVSIWAVQFAVCVSKWATRRSTRLALRQLTKTQLHDVGLTPAQAKTEAARVFWKA